MLGRALMTSEQWASRQLISTRCIATPFHCDRLTRLFALPRLRVWNPEFGYLNLHGPGTTGPDAPGRVLLAGCRQVGDGSLSDRSLSRVLMTALGQVVVPLRVGSGR